MLTRERLRTARTKFVHRWHAAQTTGERLGNDAVGERFEHINHARSLAEYVWRYGVFEESDDGAGRIARHDIPYSLREVVAPVAAKGRAHLRMAARYALLVVRHGPENTGSLGGEAPDTRGAEQAEHQEDLQRYGEQHEDITVFADRVVALHRGMLRYYVQMRFLTPAEAEYCNANPIPLFAPFGEPEERAGEPQPADPAGELPEDPVSALRGAFARNIYNALVARARAELLETVSRHPEGRAVATETTARSPRHQFTTTAIVQGRRRRFAIQDGALTAMLQSLYEEPMPPIVRWLAAFRTAVSAMITAMPMFIVKNFFRDTLSGFVAGRYWQIPFLSTLAGSAHAVHDLVTGRSDAMREYLLQGGFFSALVESETQVGDRRTVAALGRLGHWGSRLVHLLTRPAWITEAGTRVNQFRKARARGATNYAAARAARMVSADFANVGASRPWRMYVHTVPFMNAAIQGFDQLYQIFRRRVRSQRGEPIWDRDHRDRTRHVRKVLASPWKRSRAPCHDRRRHVRKVLAAGLFLGLMTGAAWRYNTSDDTRLAAYQAETEYEKASWITLYDVAGDRDVRIPTPFQIGAVFMKAPEVVLDLAAGADTLAGPRFVWSLIHGNLAIGWIPAIAQPVVEVRTNRNFFGNEIIPAYMLDWLPEQQYFPRSTPELYRVAGRLMGVSPLHVQTFVRGWTGHLGHAVVTGADELMWDTERNGPKPFPRFVGLVTGLASLQPPPLRTVTRYSNEFYEIADWFSAYARSVPERHPARRVRTAIERVRRQVADGRRTGDVIRASPEYTREEKEGGLTRLYERIDGEFREALPVMRVLHHAVRRADGPAEARTRLEELLVPSR